MTEILVLHTYAYNSPGSDSSHSDIRKMSEEQYEDLKNNPFAEIDGEDGAEVIVYDASEGQGEHVHFYRKVSKEELIVTNMTISVFSLNKFNPRNIKIDIPDLQCNGNYGILEYKIIN